MRGRGGSDGSQPRQRPARVAFLVCVAIPQCYFLFKRSGVFPFLLDRDADGDALHDNRAVGPAVYITYGTVELY